MQCSDAHCAVECSDVHNAVMCIVHGSAVMRVGGGILLSTEKYTVQRCIQYRDV